MVGTGPFLGETEMTIERATEAFGQLHTDAWPRQYLTFNVMEATWAPVFTMDLELAGYELREGMDHHDAG